MKLHAKLLAATLLPTALIWIVCFTSLQEAERSLHDAITRRSRQEAKTIMAEIDRDIAMRVTEWRAIAVGPVRDLAVRSNAAFARMDDREAEIDLRDAHWRTAPAARPDPLIDDLLNDPVSRTLRAHIHEGARREGYAASAEVFATNRYGATIALTNRTSDYRQDDEAWWQRAMADGVHVTEVGFDESANVYSIDICLRVEDANGQPVGVLKVVLDIREIIETLGRHATGGTRLVLMTAEGRTIHRTDRPHAPLDVVETPYRALADGDSSFEFAAANGRILTSVVRSPGAHGWILAVEQPLRNASAPFALMRRRIVGLVLVATLLALFAGLMIACSLANRIGRLRRAASAIGRGRLDIALPTRGRDELDHLAETFNEMAAELAANKAQLADEIAQRERTFESLRQRQRLESLGALAGGVAHEFNNMLQTILGYTQFAAEQLDGTAEVQHDLEQVLVAGERAAALTDQLLGFGRKRTLEMNLVDPAALIDEALALVTPMMQGRVRLRTTWPGPLPPVLVDRLTMVQVLVNLIINARDATPRDGSVEISASAVEERIVIAIRDTGCGMSPEVRERAMEPFFTTKPFGEGTGLGLAMAFGIVEQHGGRLDIESAEGAGTTIRISLAAQDGVARPRPPRRRTSTAKRLSRTARRVLVAEDEASVRALAVRVLRQAGYQTYEAEDGEQALTLLATQPPHARIDCAILDVVMPGLHGNEVFTRLRNMGLVVPVIFATGFDPGAELTELASSHGTPILSKPYSPDALLDAVGAVLRSRRALSA